MLNAFEKSQKLDQKIIEKRPGTAADFFYINKHIKIKPEKCLKMLKSGIPHRIEDPRSTIRPKSVPKSTWIYSNQAQTEVGGFAIETQRSSMDKGTSSDGSQYAPLEIRSQNMFSKESGTEEKITIIDQINKKSRRKLKNELNNFFGYKPN